MEKTGKLIETQEPFGPPLKTGVIVVRHQIDKETFTAGGAVVGFIAGLLVALLVQGAMRGRA